MASTTKTTNLELSQFVGTDKPAWLTDYNGDMQKIDNGYKKLEDANKATQADLDTTKQDLNGSKTDINGVKANVQALEAQDIALGNRLTVVEGNYDRIHHEVAINSQNIAEQEQAINNKVDKTGNPDIKKISQLIMHSPDLVKGVTPAAQKYMQMRFQDNSESNTNETNLGRVAYTGKMDGTNNMQVVCMKNDSSTDSVSIEVGYNSAGAYAKCPTPTNPNSKNTDIATTEWIYNRLGNFKIYKGTIGAGVTLNIGVQPYVGMYEFMSGHAEDTTLIGDYKVFGTKNSKANIVTNVKEASGLTVTPTNSGLTVKNNSSSNCEYVFIRYYCSADADVTFA